MGMLGNNTNAQFDPRKFTWLGSSSSFANDAYILIVRKDIPVKTIDDARRQGGEPLVLGGTAEGATGNDVPIILRDTIGLNVKQVVGYPDSGAHLPRHGARRGPRPHHRSLVGQGDQAGMAASPTAASTCWCSSRARPGTRISRTCRRRASSRATRPSRLLIELTEIPYKLSRPFAAPPGIPAARAQALQRAFAATHRDPQYLADAAKQRIDVSPVTADEVLQALKRIESAPQQQLDYLRRLFTESKT